MAKLATAQRVSKEISDNYVFQRSLLAYHYAAERVNGDVLEIGEVVLDPSVDVFQGHALPLCAVDGKLYQGHVGVWGSFRHGVWPGCRRSRGPLHLRALRSQRERKVGHERRGHKASPAPPPP